MLTPKKITTMYFGLGMCYSVCTEFLVYAVLKQWQYLFFKSGPIPFSVFKFIWNNCKLLWLIMILLIGLAEEDEEESDEEEEEDSDEGKNFYTPNVFQIFQKKVVTAKP